MHTKFSIYFMVALAMINFSYSKAQYMGGDDQYNREQDDARCQAGEEVFDQTDIINSTAYKTASPQEKAVMLTNAFYDKVGTTLISGGLSGIGNKALTAASMVGILYSLGKYPYLQSAVGSIAGAGGWHEIIAPLIRKVKTVGSGLYKRYVSGYENTDIGKLESKYIINRPSFNPKLQRTLDAAFVKAYCTDSKKAGDNELEKVRIAFELPTVTKELTFDPDKFNKAFSQEYTYPAGTVKELELFAANVARSSQQLPTTVKPSPKISYYFYGPPSTGKTTALSLIADMYDIPVEIIHLEDDAEYLQGNREEPGQIIQRLISHKPGQKAIKNKIIFFDDADTVLKNPGAIYDLILRWTEGQTVAMYSPYFAADIDISKLIFVFAGNTPIEELYDPKGALKSRLLVVDFPEYSPDYKLKVVWDKIIPELLAESKETAKVPVSLNDFSDTDRRNIAKMVAKSDFRTIKTKLKNIVLRKEHDKAYSKK